MAKEAPPRKHSQKKPAAGAGAPKKPASAADAAAKSAPQDTTPPPAARLREHYRERVIPDLMQKFGYRTVMQVPRLRKITLNMGVGEAVNDKKILDNAVGDLTRLAGQKAVTTKAPRSIANFKVRAGFPIGCMVTV